MTGEPAEPIERRVLLRHSFSNRVVDVVFVYNGNLWYLCGDNNRSISGGAIRVDWELAPKGNFKHPSEIERRLNENNWFIETWR